MLIFLSLSPAGHLVGDVDGKASPDLAFGDRTLRRAPSQCSLSPPPPLSLFLSLSLVLSLSFSLSLALSLCFCLALSFSCLLARSFSLSHSLYF